MPPFSPGSRLVVLGAGATRGADFGTAAVSCEPPLNRDFLTQLQRTTDQKYRTLVRDVINDIVSLFGSDFDLTLEDYFTQLEFLDDALSVGPKSSGSISPAQLRQMKARLLHAVSAVLEMSTDAAIRGGKPGCSRHGHLVDSLNAKDVVISFNYDCVIDHALRVYGNEKWTAMYGYTFPRPDRIEGVSRWDPEHPARSSKDTIYLLKLHGSLNWQLPDDPRNPDSDHRQTIRLKERLHGQRGVPYFTIIPPVWNKAASEHPTFKSLWTNAERAIRTADHIALVGFSFSQTDLPVESLFRVALARRTANLKTLVLANPSSVDRRRARQVFARPLERGRSVVRQYAGLKEFAAAFPECFT